MDGQAFDQTKQTFVHVESCTLDHSIHFRATTCIFRHLKPAQLASNANACATCHSFIKAAYSVARFAYEAGNVVRQNTEEDRMNDRFGSTRFACFNSPGGIEGSIPPEFALAFCLRAAMPTMYKVQTWSMTNLCFYCVLLPYHATKLTRQAAPSEPSPLLRATDLGQSHCVQTNMK